MLSHSVEADEYVLEKMIKHFIEILFGQISGHHVQINNRTHAVNDKSGQEEQVDS